MPLLKVALWQNYFCLQYAVSISCRAAALIRSYWNIDSFQLGNVDGPVDCERVDARLMPKRYVIRLFIEIFRKSVHFSNKKWSKQKKKRYLQYGSCGRSILLIWRFTSTPFCRAMLLVFVTELQSPFVNFCRKTMRMLIWSASFFNVD